MINDSNWYHDLSSNVCRLTKFLSIIFSLINLLIFLKINVYYQPIINYFNLKNNLSTFYFTVQETLSNMSQLKEQADFVQMENIDLCQALRGTKFKTQLKKLWDIQKIIGNIEIGFSSLQWDHCEQQASVACEGNQENLYKLYCENHSEVLGSHFQSSINLIHDLRYNIILLNELERHLISLQERIEYFNIEEDKKNPVLFQTIKELIEEKFGELNTLLESMASKCFRIDQLITKTISTS